MSKILLGKISKTFIYALLCIFSLGGVFALSGCSGNGESSTISTEQQTQEQPAVVDDGGLPPDPGEVGMATLEGIDSDADGVRDDVQRYIATTHPDSEKTRAILTQYAKALQKALLDAGSKELSMQNAEKINLTSECGDFILSIEVYRNILKKLRPEILNTDARSKAYLQYDDQLGGEVFRSIQYDQRASACDFYPESMAN